MAPTVILIRHAQAEHISLRNYDLPDPPLTALGFGEQCAALAQVLEHHTPIAHDIDLIVVSPLRRTLQTAEQALGWLMRAKDVPVVLRADWQENSDKPCDTGTPAALMRDEWPQFDWAAVDPLFPQKTGIYGPLQRDVEARGRAVRRWLRARPEKVIAVVSHSAFLRLGVSRRCYDNADFRIFDFAHADDDAAALKEWDLTEQKGGGMGKSIKGDYGWESQPFP